MLLHDLITTRSCWKRITLDFTDCIHCIGFLALIDLFPPLCSLNRGIVEQAQCLEVNHGAELWARVEAYEEKEQPAGVDLPLGFIGMTVCFHSIDVSESSRCVVVWSRSYASSDSESACVNPVNRIAIVSKAGALQYLSTVWRSCYFCLLIFNWSYQSWRC